MDINLCGFGLQCRVVTLYLKIQIIETLLGVLEILSTVLKLYKRETPIVFVRIYLRIISIFQGLKET